MVAAEGIFPAPLAPDDGERCYCDPFGRLHSLSGTLRLLVFDLEAELKRGADRLRAEVEQRKSVEAALRQAREDADQAQRAKTEFLRLMNHELRTPLNAIIGFSEIMRLELFGQLGNPVYRGYANDIYRAGQHLLELFRDILDFACLNAQMMPMDSAPIAVAPLLETCRAMFADSASEAGVELAVEVAEGAPALIGDELRVRQIVAHLISNAIKFTPSSGQIALTAAAGPDGYRFTVSDTGVGIPADEIHAVLAPFGRSQKSVRNGIDGVGLGLTLAKCLAERHGGRLELVSQPDRGTSVTVVFPPERVAGRAGGGGAATGAS